TTYDFELAAVNSAGTGTFSSASASATTLAVVSDNSITATTGNLIFAPSTGKASLSSGISTVTLSDDTSLDFAKSFSTASGGNINVGGSTFNLNSYKSGTLSNVDLTVPQNIGGQSIAVNKAVNMTSGQSGIPVTIKNNAIPNISASIPDGTTVLAPSGWDGKIAPPKTGSSSGTTPSGFSVGGTVIEVGSPTVVLLFDKPVTVLLSGVTGAVGYKPAGSNTWTQITNVCGETFTSPSNPTFPGECSISNGVDTKIVTYHFTTFGSFSSSSGSRGGGGGDSTPPSIVTTFDSEFPVTINDGMTISSYTAEQLISPIKTVTVETGTPVKSSLLLYDNSGPNNISHVEMYVNKHNSQILNDLTETYIIWEKNKDVQILNPYGIILDATVKQTILENKALFTFDVTFAKEFDTSDIVFSVWDEKRNGMKVHAIDALHVISAEPGTEPDKPVMPESDKDISVKDTQTTESVDAEMPDQIATIRQWAGYDAVSATDVQLLDSLGIDTDDTKQYKIPSWVKKNLGKWVIDGKITIKEMAVALENLKYRALLD
ncbi:MAG: hypothetical protein CO032_00815, partial [Nitrosopumilales archaeon CG_4_9_14_0_2_um_filter_34_16]